MGPIACKYCNRILAPLRSLTDGEFCCDEHRQLFKAEHVALAVPDAAQSLLPLVFPVSPAAALACPVVAFPEDLRSFGFLRFPQAIFDAAPVAGLEPVQSLVPLPFKASPAAAPRGRIAVFAADLGSASVPRLPQAKLNPVAIPFVPPPAVEPEPIVESFLESSLEPQAELPIAEEPAPPLGRVAASRRWLLATWTAAPMELKAMTFLLPVLLAAAGLLPRVQVPHTEAAKQKLANQWKGFAQVISHRAAIAFNDDFRSGLDAWESRSNLTTSWSYDRVGFVQPGPLALYRPTEDLTDYRFEFLGEIEHKALGCAVRAKDLDNYYALKFTAVTSGPLPSVRLVRYAVINGKEGPHVEKQLPASVRADMLYRVVVEARGNDFTVTTQGEMVDFWSDGRLQKGGVGLFCGRGEKARLRWVSVSHQYDTLGRLCAFLVPNGLEGLGGT
jgi:hypothetical protein